MPEKPTEDSEAVPMIKDGLKSGITKPEMPAKALWVGSSKFEQ